MKNSIKNSIRNWIGPNLIYLGQRILSQIIPPRLKYVPDGWATLLPIDKSQGWNDQALVENNSRKINLISQLCKGTGPLGFSYEDDELKDTRNIYFHNIHMTYAYVLALVAHKKDIVSILDWGGGIGHYYLLSKTVLPEVEIDYHCVEVPKMAKMGEKINPEIRWYSDDSFLNQTYD